MVKGGGWVVADHSQNPDFKMPASTTSSIHVLARVDAWQRFLRWLVGAVWILCGILGPLVEHEFVSNLGMSGGRVHITEIGSVVVGVLIVALPQTLASVVVMLAFPFAMIGFGGTLGSEVWIHYKVVWGICVFLPLLYGLTMLERRDIAKQQTEEGT